MKLSIADRIALLQLLPEEGNLLTMRIVRQLRESLSFDEAEHADLNFVSQTDGRLTWDDPVELKEIQIGAKGMGFVADALTELSKSEQVREYHLALFDKFGIEEG